MVHFDGDPEADDGDDLFGDVEGLDEIKSKWVFPDAEYEFTVLTAERKTSKKGNPMVEWEVAATGMKLVDGEMVDASADIEPGTEVRTWTSLAPQALFAVKAAAEALGLPIEGGRIKAKKSDIIGRRFIGRTETRKYKRDDGSEGESSGIKTWLPHPEGAEFDG